MASINDSIAKDPVKYIRISFSLHDFQPNSNIVDNDGMPGEPSLPPGSVLGTYLHGNDPFGSSPPMRKKLAPHRARPTLRPVRRAARHNANRGAIRACTEQRQLATRFILTASWRKRHRARLRRMDLARYSGCAAIGLLFEAASGVRAAVDSISTSSRATNHPSAVANLRRHADDHR
jgi:hypothetical protein